MSSRGLAASLEKPVQDQHQLRPAFTYRVPLQPIGAQRRCVLTLTAVRHASQGDSDLQLERVNVYFNEAGGGAQGPCLRRCSSLASVCKVISYQLTKLNLPNLPLLRRAVCAARNLDGPGARDHGLRALGAVWPDLPARQLHLRPGVFAHRVYRTLFRPQWLTRKLFERSTNELISLRAPSAEFYSRLQAPAWTLSQQSPVLRLKQRSVPCRPVRATTGPRATTRRARS